MLMAENLGAFSLIILTFAVWGIWELISWLRKSGIPTPCPYCSNPDRDFWITDKQNLTGACKFDVSTHGGSDPPCICDNYGARRGY